MLDLWQVLKTQSESNPPSTLIVTYVANCEINKYSGKFASIWFMITQQIKNGGRKFPFVVVKVYFCYLTIETTFILANIQLMKIL